MKNKQTYLIIALIVFCFVGLFYSKPTFAATSTAIVTQSCDDVDTNILSCPGGTSDVIGYFLVLIVKILSVLVAIAATVGIVYGSIMYTTSGGKAENTKKGREIITNTIIGLVAYALMYAVLNFVIPGGITW